MWNCWQAFNMILIWMHIYIKASVQVVVRVSVEDEAILQPNIAVFPEIFNPCLFQLHSESCTRSAVDWLFVHALLT